tara:strand:+ start:1202 stop:1345 length:144 start_codon:yes stop_codon:yes gene_type:complete
MAGDTLPTRTGNDIASTFSIRDDRLGLSSALEKDLRHIVFSKKIGSK